MPGVLDSRELELDNVTKKQRYRVHHGLSARQVKMVTAGGMINLWRRKQGKDRETTQTA